MLILYINVLQHSQEAKCAYVVLLMGVYWITESLPVAVTAMLPVLLFPTLGIVDTDKVTAKYFNVSSNLWNI